MYETLLDIASGSIGTSRPSHRGISLFQLVSLNRTCDEMTIPPQYCACERQYVMDNDDETAVGTAIHVLDYINKASRIRTRLSNTVTGTVWLSGSMSATITVTCHSPSYGVTAATRWWVYQFSEREITSPCACHVRSVRGGGRCRCGICLGYNPFTRLYSNRPCCISPTQKHRTQLTGHYQLFPHSHGTQPLTISQGLKCGWNALMRLGSV
jgi:hypothetical protein